MNLRVDIALDSGTLKKSLYEISGGFVNLVTEDGRRLVTEAGVELCSETDLFYEGDLKTEIEVTEKMSDVFYGIAETSPFTAQFANGDGEWDAIIAAEEVRGRSVTVRREGGQFFSRGKITGIDIRPDCVELSVDPSNDEVFDTLLPAAVVTVDDFSSTAVDTGSPRPVIFGHAKNVPLANIQNDTVNDYYDYLIGYGTVESLWIDHSNGRGVKRDGVLVAETEYTFYDGSQGSPFAGFAFIRFTVEQKDFGGNFHNLTADVYGLELGGSSSDRNYANVIKAILENTTWGLSETVDSASFSEAAAALPTTSWMCDGFIYEQTAARDILNDLLFVARGRLSRNADGAWKISIDGTGSSVASFGDHDGYWNNCKIKSVSLESSDRAIKKAIVTYDSDSLKMEIDVNTGFGVEKTYSLPFVLETDTGVKVLSYVYGRALYAGKQISLDADSDSGNVQVGDVVSLSSGPRNLSAVTYKIIELTKRLNDATLKCEYYDSSIFDDQAPSEPTANDDSTDVHALQTIASGSVGGWSVDANALKNGTNIILDAANKAISINDSTFGSQGIQLQYNGGTPRLYAGKDADAFFKFDGTYIYGTFNNVVNMTAQAGCLVTLSANQTTAAATGAPATSWTQIDFDTETWDTGSDWSEYSSGLYGFTVPEDGKYIITAQLVSECIQWVDGERWETAVDVGGVVRIFHSIDSQYTGSG